jgi:uncharacterized membrane protein YhfC
MKNFRLKEWQRTVILLALLVLAIGFIIWSKNQYNTNFVDNI